MNAFRVLTTALLLCCAAPVLAQGTNVTFGAITQDTSLPVEVTADNLAVDQSSGTAVFTGNVMIGQTLVTGQDAAEAERADYSIDSGEIEMSGNVLLTQGNSALTAEKMFVNLRNGTARMSGRVKTILQTGNN